MYIQVEKQYEVIEKKVNNITIEFDIEEYIKRNDIKIVDKSDLEYIIHLVKNKKAGLYGFVSSHAANTVGFALLSSLIIRRKIYSIAAFSWAGITCYSRMYLGMHFPFDIIGGAVTGIVIALTLYLFKKLYLKSNTLSTYDNAEIPVYTLIITTLSIALFSFFG